MKRQDGYTTETAAAYKQLGIEGTTYEFSLKETARLLGDISGTFFIDFGCGAGRTTKFLKALGAARVLGVDTSSQMIEQAQADSQEDIEFQRIQNEIPVPGEAADGVLSAHVFIELRTTQELQHACREIARVLKPGGVFLMISTNPAAFGHEFKDYSYAKISEKTKSGDRVACTVKGENPFTLEDTYWTEEDYRQAIEAAGMQIADIRFPKAESGEWLDELVVAPDIVLKAAKP